MSEPRIVELNGAFKKVVDNSRPVSRDGKGRVVPSATREGLQGDGNDVYPQSAVENVRIGNQMFTLDHSVIPPDIYRDVRSRLVGEAMVVELIRLSNIYRSGGSVSPPASRVSQSPAPAPSPAPAFAPAPVPPPPPVSQPARTNPAENLASLETAVSPIVPVVAAAAAPVAPEMDVFFVFPFGRMRTRVNLAVVDADRSIILLGRSVGAQVDFEPADNGSYAKIEVPGVGSYDFEMRAMRFPVPVLGMNLVAYVLADPVVDSSTGA